MKHRRFFPTAMALCFCVFLVTEAKSQTQGAPPNEKIQELSQVLNLSPQQKSQLAPILEAEAPKVEAVKDNPSLSGREKKKQLKAVHEQADPLVKSILNTSQYQQWQDIRKDEMEQMKEKK